ncbi:MAG: CDP-alcohol phosphatidyltransferase family protein [Candidatus Staskawiczbacteria bacterium]
MIIENLTYFLEKIDRYRDELLFRFIKPCWPRKITPNLITWMRVFVGLILFILLFYFGIEDKVLILYLFFFGVITDLFDGSVARCLNKITEFGTMLDPVADRVLILPIAIYSLHEHHKWLLLIFLLFEMIGALVAMYQKSRENDVKANIFGKTRMVLLSIVFFAILVYWPEEVSVVFINLLWASLILSILSIFVRVIELNKKGYINNKFLNRKLNKNRKHGKENEITNI